MLAHGLSTRYEFGGEAVGDTLLTRTAGKRREDGRDVCLVVFQEAAGVSQAQAVKAVESAGALAQLGLPTVLAMLESGRDEDGHIYMVFESSDMPSLKSVIRERGGLSPAEALDVIHAVASTLGRTAAAGVDHLDLTSSTVHCNLLTGEPLKVRIEGFGLAGLLPSYNPARKASPYYGNAEYMAPEICSGRPGNSSSDLYALGILLYEMVAGKPPFVSAGASTTIKRQVYEKPLPLHLVKPGLQRLDSFESLVTRLLVKDPTGRPASAADVVDAIVKLREDAFPDISLNFEDRRRDYPVPTSMFVDTLPQPAQVAGAPGETMAFEGLSEAVARMIEVQEAAAREPSPQPDAESGLKTEAFDASFIASVVEQAAAGADIGDVISDVRSRVAESVEPVVSAGSSPVQIEKAPAPAKPEKQTKKDKPPKKTGKTGAVPAATQPRPAPTSQVQSMKKKPANGGRKGSAVIVVVVLALAVLLAIGAAIWWKSRQTSSAGLPETVSSVAVDRERQAAEARRGQAVEQVSRGRVFLDRGDLAGAEAAVVEALRIDAGLPEALKLRSDVMAAKAAAEDSAQAARAPEPTPVEQEAVAAPATPVPAQPAVAAETPRPAPTSLRPRRSKIQPTSVTALKSPATDDAPVVEKVATPAPEPATDPRVEANALRASARAAYKAGDCARTVSLLEKIRALGQFNTLDAGIMKKCASNPE